jgi:hypothetical protein
MTNSTYLGSPLNIISEEAYDRISKELETEREEPNVIPFPNLGLNAVTTKSNCYVDLGFHMNIHQFGEALDNLYGIDRISTLPPHLIGREYLEGGGVTRAYSFFDEEKKPFDVWTTFYRLDRNGAVNLFIRGHEQGHVFFMLNEKDRLLDHLKKVFPKLKSHRIEDESEELIATLTGYIPVVNSGKSPIEVVRNLSNYTTTIERELKRSLELIT